MSKHTPTPWSLNKVENYIESKEGGLIAIVRTGGLDPLENYDMKIKANATHIVKCVNLHDELVKELELRVSELGERMNHLNLYQRLSELDKTRIKFDYAKDLLKRARGDS